MRCAALLLLLSGVVGVLAGCGGTQATPAQLRLEREDLIAISRALRRVEPSVTHELVAAKSAWPLIANGLPGGPLHAVRAHVKTAAQSATGIAMLALFGEAQAASLTGPTALLAGLFRTYRGLTTRGWQLTGSAIDEIEAARAPATESPGGGAAGANGAGTAAAANGAGTAPGTTTASRTAALAAARFARDNVALYIESIYDGHFDLAQIGKKLSAGYAKLGGAAAFGNTLTPAEVSSLADAYSEASARLHPHVGVRLGS